MRSRCGIEFRNLGFCVRAASESTRVALPPPMFFDTAGMDMRTRPLELIASEDRRDTGAIPA
jgi:hypothetical protein